jgi:hypothetical protein
MRTCTKTACCLHQAAPSVGWDEGTAKMPLARPAEVDGTGPLTLPPRCTVQVTRCRHRIPTSTLGGKRKSETHLLFEHLRVACWDFVRRISATLYVRTGESCSSWRVARIRVGVTCVHALSLDEAVLIYFDFMHGPAGRVTAKTVPARRRARSRRRARLVQSEIVRPTAPATTACCVSETHIHAQLSMVQGALVRWAPA